MIEVDTVKAIWERSKVSPGAFSMIPVSSPIQFFLGFEKSNKALLMISTQKPEKMTDTHGINILSGQRRDGRWATTFTLQDTEAKQIFEILVTDLLKTVDNVSTEEKALDNLHKRLTLWSQMLKKKRDSGFSLKKQKKLYGELFYIKQSATSPEKLSEILRSWVGPEGGDQDFVNSENWYETKTIRSTSTKVKISSLEQLDNPKRGKLVVFLIEYKKGTIKLSDWVTLSGLVESIRTQIQKTEDLDLFNIKLSLTGYPMDEKYDIYSFVSKDIRFYSVNDSFPRILRNNVSSKVENAQYTLDLETLKEWRL